MTPNYKAVLNSKVQNFEIELSPNTMHRAEMWFKTA
jgi:hypothetical protein